jgi:hypothetical protein
VLHRGRELRRFPRLRSRCRVLVHDRFGASSAETEDVGPRGCRIVTARPQRVGAVVRLTIESDTLDEPLEIAGQVVWVRDGVPAQAGIAYAGTGTRPGAVASGAWFGSLAAAMAASRRPGARPPARASPEITIVLGAPEPVDPLPRRLAIRAQELLRDGQVAAAEVIARRALALAPGDPALEALVREMAAR